MDCYYHPGKESISACTVCGKPICAECSMEIAGKTYCKDCLEKIIGMSEPKINENIAPSNDQISNTLEEMTPQYDEYDYYEKEIPTPSYDAPTNDRTIGDILNNEPENYNESPYALNNFENQNMLNQSYETESPYTQDALYPSNDNIRQTDNFQPLENQFQQQTEPLEDDGFIYPDHSYQPPEIPNREIESKYEHYLEDLYFDEPEIPLTEQIARDETNYGSLTKNPQEIRPNETYYNNMGSEYSQYIPPANNYNEKGFLNINNVTHNNPQGDFIPQQVPPAQHPNYNQAQSPRQKGGYDAGLTPSTKSIHNIRNMETGKEPYGVVDILLTVILIVLVILVVFYIVYLFILSSSYPTFADALFGLSDPGTFFGNLIGK